MAVGARRQVEECRRCWYRLSLHRPRVVSVAVAGGWEWRRATATNRDSNFRDVQVGNTRPGSGS